MAYELLVRRIHGCSRQHGLSTLKLFLLSNSVEFCTTEYMYVVLPESHFVLYCQACIEGSDRLHPSVWDEHQWYVIRARAVYCILASSARSRLHCQQNKSKLTEHRSSRKFLANTRASLEHTSQLICAIAVSAFQDFSISVMHYGSSKATDATNEASSANVLVNFFLH